MVKDQFKGCFQGILTWTKPYQPDQVIHHIAEESCQGFVAGGR